MKILQIQRAFEAWRTKHYLRVSEVLKILEEPLQIQWVFLPLLTKDFGMLQDGRVLDSAVKL